MKSNIIDQIDSNIKYGIFSPQNSGKKLDDSIEEIFVSSNINNNILKDKISDLRRINWSDSSIIAILNKYKNIRDNDYDLITKYFFNALDQILSNKLPDTLETIEAITKFLPKNWELKLGSLCSNKERYGSLVKDYVDIKFAPNIDKQIENIFSSSNPSHESLSKKIFTIRKQGWSDSSIEAVLKKFNAFDPNSNEQVVKCFLNALDIIEKYKINDTEESLNAIIKSNHKNWESSLLKIAGIYSQRYNDPKSQSLSIEDRIFLIVDSKDPNYNIIYEKVLYLQKMGWSNDSVVQLLDEFGKYLGADIENLKDTLDIIINYKLASKDCVGCYGKEPVVWNKDIRGVAVGTTFRDSNIKDPDTLIKELENNNSQDINLIKQRFYEVQKAYNKQSTIYHNSTKEISNWGISEVNSWASIISGSSFKVQQSNVLPEVIAVVKRAVHLTSGYEPRDIQILSVLSLMDVSKNYGRLAQIFTGEGKSTTIAILSSITALQGHKIDIVTSSEVLAVRDAQEQKDFYKLLCLSVAHNIDIKKEYSGGAKDCYKQDIVYGTSHSFQADILRDEYKLEGTLNGRKPDIVVVDEVDSMFIDEHNRSTLLAEPKPGMEKLAFIMLKMWQELQNVKLNKEGKIEIPTDDKPILVDPEQYLKDVGKILISGDEQNKASILLPNYLKNFTLENISKWAKNAVLAKNYFKKDHHYIIDKGNIVPVDYKNTGVIQTNTQLGDGLHQFLQLKHKLKLTPESLTTNYLSNVGFFKRYINKNEKNEIIATNIYGLTGTLGSKEAQKLLSKVYNVDFVFVPSYKPRQLIELPGIISESQDKWVNKVVKNITDEASNGRAVLVICETINAVKMIEQKLSTVYPKNNITSYTRNDNEENKVVEVTMSSGKVILATNLAGRGTDIKLTKEVQKSGGLHVCVTFLPSNLRVEEQAFGRTGRQGEAGTAQLVLDYYSEIKKLGLNKQAADQILGLRKAIDAYNKIGLDNPMQNDVKQYFDLVPQDIKEFKAKRNETEIQILASAEKEIAKIELQDELFAKFCSLINVDIENLQSDQATLGAIEERWGVWLRELDIEKPRERILKDFKEFRSQILKEYADDKVIINQSYLNQKCLKALVDGIMPTGTLKATGYIVRRVWEKITDWPKYDKLYDDVIDKCDESLNIDPTSFIPYINKAVAFIKNEKGNYKNDAIKIFQKAQDVIEEEVYFLIGFMEAMKQMNSSQDNIKSLENKIGIYYSIKEQILKNNIEEIEAAIKDDRGIVLRANNIEEIFNDKSIKDEVSELKLNGLSKIFTVKERASWWSITGVMLLGIGQLVFGAVLMSNPVSAVWGMGLMAEGVSDILTGVTSGMSGNFSWKEWGIQKVIGVATTVLLCGATTLYSKYYLNQAAQLTTSLTIEGGIWGAFKKAPLSTIKNGMKALLGREYTWLLKEGVSVIGKPQIWQVATSVLVRRLYQEGESSLKTSNSITFKYKDFMDRQNELMKNRILDSLKNSGIKENLKSSAEIESLGKALESKLKKELAELINQKLQGTQLIKDIVALDAINPTEKIMEKLQLNETINKLITSSNIDYSDIINAHVNNTKSVLQNLESLVKNYKSCVDKIEKSAEENIDKLLNDLNKQFQSNNLQIDSKALLKNKIAQEYQKVLIQKQEELKSKVENTSNLSYNEQKSLVTEAKDFSTEAENIKNLDQYLNDVLKKDFNGKIQLGNFDLNMKMLNTVVNNNVNKFSKDQVFNENKLKESFTKISDNMTSNFVDKFKIIHTGQQLNKLKNIQQSQINKNAYSEYNNNDYQYTGIDIEFISNQIMGDYASYFNILKALDKDNLSILKDADLSKPIFTVYNINQLHWVTLCLIKNNQSLIVLCKDSFGKDSYFSKEISNDIAKILSNYKIDFKFNLNKEQGDETSCGIFALKNMEIIAKEIIADKVEFIDNFVKFSKFCSQKEAGVLRKEDFANKYAIEMTEQQSKELINSDKRSQVRQNHDSEIMEIIEILKSNSSIKNFGIVTENVNLMKQDVIKLEINLGKEELTDDYKYHYCITLKYIQDEQKIIMVRNNVISALKLRNNDYIFEDNIIRISADKLKNTISQQNKIQISSLKVDVDIKIAFQASIQQLNVHNDNQADRLIGALKSSKNFMPQDLETFEELVKVNKIMVSATEEVIDEQKSAKDIKLELVKNLLKRNKYSIDEIAEDTGFNSIEILEIKEGMELLSMSQI